MLLLDGMGGIGKTTVSAWLVRKEDVRRHFELICWVPLGQTPVLEKCQEILYLQLTGSDLHPSLSESERQEQLRQAMASRKVLLVLDDL